MPLPTSPVTLRHPTAAHSAGSRRPAAANDQAVTTRPATQISVGRTVWCPQTRAGSRSVCATVSENSVADCMGSRNATTHDEDESSLHQRVRNHRPADAAGTAKAIIVPGTWISIIKRTAATKAKTTVNSPKPGIRRWRVCSTSSRSSPPAERAASGWRESAGKIWLAML